MSINFRGNIDKAAPSFFLHAWECSLGQEKWTNDEEVQHRAVELFVVFFDRFLWLVWRGIGNNNVNRTELVSSLFEKPFDL